MKSHRVTAITALTAFNAYYFILWIIAFNTFNTHSDRLVFFTSWIPFNSIHKTSLILGVLTLLNLLLLFEPFSKQSLNGLFKFVCIIMNFFFGLFLIWTYL